MIWFLLIVLGVGLDQATKFLVVKNISMYESKGIIDKLFYLTHYENRGIAFSMLEDKRIIFVPVIIILLVFIGYWMYKSKSSYLNVCLILITSGAIGNLIDRIAKNGVVDFIEFRFGSHSSPIMNIADIFIIVGTFMLVYYLLASPGKKII